MANKNTYQSITLYKDMAPQILELEKEEAGEILQAIMRYSCYGKDTDISQYDRFVRSLWQTIKLKLQAGEEHQAYISDVRSKAGRKGGEAKASNSHKDLANEAKASNSTTDTVTGTNSLTTTISSTVTKQERADAASCSADRRSASAAAKAEPAAGDLFSVKQLAAKVKQNKVKLTEEGNELPRGKPSSIFRDCGTFVP